MDRDSNINFGGKPRFFNSKNPKSDSENVAWRSKEATGASESNYRSEMAPPTTKFNMEARSYNPKPMSSSGSNSNQGKSFSLSSSGLPLKITNNKNLALRILKGPESEN